MAEGRGPAVMRVGRRTLISKAKAAAAAYVLIVQPLNNYRIAPLFSEAHRDLFTGIRKDYP